MLQPHRTGLAISQEAEGTKPVYGSARKYWSRRVPWIHALPKISMEEVVHDFLMKWGFGSRIANLPGITERFGRPVDTAAYEGVSVKCPGA